MKIPQRKCYFFKRWRARTNACYKSEEPISQQLSSLFTTSAKIILRAIRQPDIYSSFRSNGEDRYINFASSVSRGEVNSLGERRHDESVAVSDFLRKTKVITANTLRMGNFDMLRLKREEDGPRVESERRSEFHLSKQQKAGGCGLASCNPPPERSWAAAAAAAAISEHLCGLSIQHPLTFL